MQKRYFVLVAALLFSLTACTHSSQAGDSSVQPQTVKANQPFTIALESNPTTGYQWQLKQLPAHVKLLKQRYQQNQDCPSGMVGCGGKETFTLQADQTGKLDLVFEYGRSWEKEAGQRRTISVNVQ